MRPVRTHLTGAPYSRDPERSSRPGVATSAVPTLVCDDGSMLRNTVDRGSQVPWEWKRPPHGVEWDRKLFGRAGR